MINFHLNLSHASYSPACLRHCACREEARATANGANNATSEIATPVTSETAVQAEKPLLHENLSDPTEQACLHSLAAKDVEKGDTEEVDTTTRPNIVTLNAAAVP